MTDRAVLGGTGLAVVVVIWASMAGAVMPGEEMADPGLEQRARALYRELRCVVCQNQSIDASDAEIAADMRALVRQRLLTGDSDEALRDAMVARYGTYVLLDPPMTPLTYGLWFGPPVLLVAGLIGVLAWRRRHRPSAPILDDDAPLSADEQARLATVLQDADREQQA